MQVCLVRHRSVLVFSRSALGSFISCCHSAASRSHQLSVSSAPLVSPRLSAFHCRLSPALCLLEHPPSISISTVVCLLSFFSHASLHPIFLRPLCEGDEERMSSSVFHAVLQWCRLLESVPNAACKQTESKNCLSTLSLSQSGFEIFRFVEVGRQISRCISVACWFTQLWRPQVLIRNAAQCTVLCTACFVWVRLKRDNNDWVPSGMRSSLHSPGRTFAADRLLRPRLVPNLRDRRMAVYCDQHKCLIF